MTTEQWLIDRSALRVGEPTVVEALAPMVARGLVGICFVTELELGFSARSVADHAALRDLIVAQLVPVVMPASAEDVARHVQHDLITRGLHRAVSVPDLVLAAIAITTGRRVLHYDADFDLLADVTGHPADWVVPRGSL